MGDYPMPAVSVTKRLRQGLVIPAHPLALTPEHVLDETHQRALTRYYLDSGAGGLAVGVHTTEFAIHRPAVGLYRPVLQLAIETANAWPTGEPPVMIAGIVGSTAQAVREARTAIDLGYSIGLLSLGALAEATEDELIRHAREVASIIPIMGFYLQPSVGGRILGPGLWRGLAELPNLVGIKIAPFNRYHTLTVLRAIAEAGRAGAVALYTGNDDSILVDLSTPFMLETDSGRVEIPIVGGLLGHWAYWTSRAVEQLAVCREARESGTVDASVLTLAAQVTEANAAVFDPDNAFRGCIAGILYVLSRTGLLAGVHPLGEHEGLSRGQAQAIDRIVRHYPHLTDDAFVRENLSRWLTP